MDSHTKKKKGLTQTTPLHLLQYLPINQTQKTSQSKVSQYIQYLKKETKKKLKHPHNKNEQNHN